ncbi:MAG: iron ABC transporter permease [Calditrichaeota bacterium]|nr:iron ABC transporter permease [Calditrichota bacterium]RQV93561.1 MAG: iron ABC transporter permease [bacterium]RQW08517.1 MAG: iron ABC transporter permease [Calditrichota bacterium]
MRGKSRKNFFLAIFAAVFCLTIFITPFIGSQNLDYSNVVSYLRGSENPDGIIFFDIRIPRILLAIVTGATLSLAGLIFQALLRNPLATPYTLGVSAGGALGAVLMIKLGITFSVLGFSTIQTAAFVGSLLTIILVYYLARSHKRISVHTMILAGITISYFFGAVILMLHFLADFTETRQMIRWMMGGLDIVDPDLLWKSIPVLLIAYLILFYHARMLNILSASEDTAWSKGVSVDRVQRIAFLLASLITGLVVAVSGPIGFVGLIVPHFLRMVLGVDHRYLIPGSLFAGGAFLAICDTFARTIISPVDIPVGIITAILGGPFFLWILVRKG